MLSVVVPAFRASRTLSAVLACLRASGAASEVVVVDDGCPDGSGGTAEAWSREHDWPVRVVYNPRNLGTSAARNVGWRATTGALVAFVDADVEVAPDALGRLCAELGEDPELVGANGTLAASPAGLDSVSAFVNTSLRYQLACHGPRVATAFTSLCVLRRASLERMGGWDERRGSRYGDDVATRWHLPARSLAQVPAAVGVHRKRVALPGLLRHRVNVGVHFVQSLRENRSALARHPRLAVLTARYPQNAALSACSLPALAAVAAPGPVGAATVGLLALTWLLGNAPFLGRVGTEDGPVRAVIALPLTILEGHALLAGVLLGLTHLLRSPDARA